jgi:hypothetical protein
MVLQTPLSLTAASTEEKVFSAVKMEPTTFTAVKMAPTTQLAHSQLNLQFQFLKMVEMTATHHATAQFAFHGSHAAHAHARTTARTHQTIDSMESCKLKTTRRSKKSFHIKMTSIILPRT